MSLFTSKRERRLWLWTLAVLVAIFSTLGLLDEGIQFILPNRIFDVRNVGFNALAGLLAIVASLALDWVQRIFKRK